MQNKMILGSLGVLMAITGCGGAVDGNGTELSRHTQELGRTAQHCVSKAFAQQKDLPIPSKLPVPQFDCFETFADAISHASKGAVQLSADTTPQTLTREDENRITASANIIGMEYDAINFTGPTWIITSDVTCSMGYVIGTSATPPGWDNVISSARAYAGCNNAYHYENANFSGVASNCYSSCSFYSLLMDNQTSSIIWTP